MAIPFVSESRPEPGVVVEAAAGVLRLTASNGGPLTYHGTNTYVVATKEGNVVIDPGPDEAAHIEALLELTRNQVTALLVTHGHGDHVGAAAAIAAATGAAVLAFPKSIAENIRIDRPIGHGDVVHGLRVLHTPGHSPDHLCFAREDGVLLSGDHVMTWSTSAVSPPRGSMIDYRRSLSLLLDADYRLLLPGHGAPSHRPPR
ncbi:MBL fold metallo-hydrolase [Rhizobium binxianense]